jgi:uncharacterized protein YfiM (DUF2279 family)
MKTCEDHALVDVPRVPACLAMTKKSSWWRRLVRLVAGTALLAGAGAAMAAHKDLVRRATVQARLLLLLNCG